MSDPLIAVDGFECGTCGHEWQAEIDDSIAEVRDSNGKLLAEGDDVIIIEVDFGVWKCVIMQLATLNS